MSCLDKLLCCDESPEILLDNLPESHPPAPPEIADSIAGLIAEELNFVPGSDYVARFRSQSLDATARRESVAWILKVKSFYNFQPLTAYLAVNYLDRFLYASHLPETDGWPMQLLSVACLSLAAKMEEVFIPSLLDLQVQGAKYIFEPRTIRRMELLILDVLNWRLRSITPFNFIHFFASNLEPTAVAHSKLLISRAIDIILSVIQDADFHEFSPSCIGAASVLCAAAEIPDLLFAKPEHAVSWCEGLTKEKIVSCSRLMQLLENSKTKPPKVRQQFRVMVCTRLRSIYSRTTPSSSSSSATSNKRRKLNNCIWVDDDKGCSKQG